MKLTRGLSVRVCLLTSLFWSGVTGVGMQPAGAQFDQLVVFGDSLSDTGNVLTATAGGFPPAPFYVDGRLSNGPVWVEYLAGTLGATPPLPSLHGGTNYAWGGAQSRTSFESYDSTLDPEPFPLTTTLSVHDQVGSFLSQVAGGAPAPNPDRTLYVVWGGANDFTIGNELSANQVAKNIKSSVTELIETVGAKHLLVPNMPSLNDLPAIKNDLPSFFVGEQQPKKLGKRVDQFNAKLSRWLSIVERKNNQVRIYSFDVNSLYQEVLTTPEAFGFNPNTGVPVLNEAAIYGSSDSDPLFLNDPATTLFWDGVHPSTLAHSVLAHGAAQLLFAAPSGSALARNHDAQPTAVPEPAGSVVLIATWLVVALIRLRGPRDVS